MAGGLAGVAPGDHNAASRRVGQDLCGIKAGAACGIELSARPVGIKLARLYFRNEGVPIMIAPADRGVQRDHLEWPRVVLSLKEQQLDCRGVAREDAEVNAAVDECGAERRTLSGVYSERHRRLGHRSVCARCQR